MTEISATERDGARVHDVRFADDAEAFLVEPIEGGRGAAVLFHHWFDTEALDGNRTWFVDEAVSLARDHGVRARPADRGRQDRLPDPRSWPILDVYIGSTSWLGSGSGINTIRRRSPIPEPRRTAVSRRSIGSASSRRR